jgi:hypothetical protein
MPPHGAPWIPAITAETSNFSWEKSTGLDGNLLAPRFSAVAMVCVSPGAVIMNAGGSGSRVQTVAITR